MVENPPANAGDAGSIPGSGRSSEGGNGNPFQYSCLENPMDRGDWQATVHGDNRELDATKSIQDKQKNILGAELFDSTYRRYLEQSNS